MAAIHRTGGITMGSIGISQEDLDFLMQPPPVSDAMKRRRERIYQTKPWEISAIARSRPLKKLKEMYLEEFYKVHPEERPQ
ncbi:hypothetical protein NIES4101_83530 [Calothrix sp. NIES-4101]|nr:hypothetical protein NIES4101_83530 [Calothrix sp. NIES-4101]